MEPVTLVTTTVGVLAQAALVLKGAKSLLDKYGDDALRFGKSIFEFVKKHLEPIRKPWLRGRQCMHKPVRAWLDNFRLSSPTGLVGGESG